MAATRPPMTFGLPHTLCASLLAAGMFFISLYDTGHVYGDLVGDAIFIGLIAMVWSVAKVLLRSDYHGWDIFVAWIRLDARFLDTAENGGARLAALPLRSVYRCEVHGNV